MSKREKEIWLDDGQWEGMIEGKHELEWLLNEVNNDIERYRRDGMGDYNEMIQRRNSILRDLDQLDQTMLHVHHMDELESEDSEEINQMIDEYADYVDPDLEEEFRRYEEDRRREMEELEELERYKYEMDRMY